MLCQYINGMEYLLGLFILLQNVQICTTVDCQVDFCRNCSSHQECLVCEQGLFGLKCEHECREDFSLCSLCSNFSMLKANSSEAECFGCQQDEYFLNGQCLPCPDTCMSCANETACYKCNDGYFGRTCSEICPQNCLRCLSQDNCSFCKEGWSGDKCLCSNQNCIQEGNMIDWCGENGTCLKGCVDGKWGSRCDTDCPRKEKCKKCEQYNKRCLRCPNGFYGSLNYCDKTCGHCKPDNQGYIKCNVETGECYNTCIDGFYSRRCDKKCANCLPDMKGLSQCDKEAGICKNGCTDGYYGSMCDLECGHCLPDGMFAVRCDIKNGSCRGKCSNGFYGSRCDKNCNYCLTNNTINMMSNCDIETGECKFDCKDGFHGQSCQLECTDYCSDPSTNSNKCDKMSGHCTFGCVHGWFGEMCETACSPTCVNKSCDQLSGKCDYGCVYGWVGDTCNETCGNACQNRSLSGTLLSQPSQFHIWIIIGVSGVIILSVFLLVTAFIVRKVVCKRCYSSLKPSNKTDAVYDEIDVL